MAQLNEAGFSWSSAGEAGCIGNDYPWPNGTVNCLLAEPPNSESTFSS
jgi:hypothetical protein